MAVNDILEIGRQGLAANRSALQTTSNNIANANTPGYSRQRPVFTSNQQGVVGGNRIGGGVEVKKVVRVHDAFVQNQIQDEARHFGAAKMKSDSLKHVERIVNNDSLRVGDMVNKFFNDVREMSASPEMPTMRQAVLSSAETVAGGFKKLNETLETAKQDLDRRVTIAVEEINTMTKELAQLNSAIFHYESVGDSPHELEDRRDAVLRQLSEKLGYQIFTDETGAANLTGGNLGILVHRGEANELTITRSAEKGDKGAGSLDIVLKDPFGSRVVTASITDGEIGGLLHVRDKVINPALQHLDKVAYEFVNQVNDVHKDGIGTDGGSGRNLFTGLNQEAGASYFMSLSDEVKNNSDAIAVGYPGEGRGDNRVALRIAEIQSKPLFTGSLRVAEGTDSTQTINESLNTMIGNIAVQASHEDQMLRHQEAVMNQLENYRQSYSGVNLEEEGINMIQYQAIFNASAKTMKIGDELFQTILAIKN